MARTMAARIAAQKARLAGEACATLRKPTARAASHETERGHLAALLIFREARMAVGDAASAEAVDELIRRMCNPAK